MKRRNAYCGPNTSDKWLWVVAGIFISLMPPSHKASAFMDQKAPEITSPAWVNSKPLSLKALHGKVVMVEFWAFGCTNCRNVEPQIKAWHHQ